MSSYNKNDTFGVKGRIGELIYANYVLDTFGSEVQEDPELQKEGVDFIVDGTRVDVKLSDKLNDFFSMAYNNTNNHRHPFRHDSNVDRIAVVTCDWEQFLKDHTARLSKEQKKLEKQLCKYMSREELNEIINKQSNKKEDDLITYLQELYAGHKIVSKLEKEYTDQKSFAETHKIVDKYVKSIRSVHPLRIVNCSRPLEYVPSGTRIQLPNDAGVVTKRDCWTRYGKMVAVEIQWIAVEDFYDSIYEEEQQSQKDTTQPTSNPCIQFGKYSGKPIEDLNSGYLKWLAYEAKNTKGQRELFKKELVKRGESRE